MKNLMKTNSIINKNFIYQKSVPTGNETISLKYEGFGLFELKMARMRILRKVEEFENLSDKEILFIGDELKEIDKKIAKIELKNLSREIDVERLREASLKFVEIEDFIIKALKDTPIYKTSSILISEDKSKIIFKDISFKINYLKKEFYSTRKTCLPTLEDLPNYLERVLKGDKVPKWIVNKIIKQTISKFKLGPGKDIYNSLVNLEIEVKGKNKA